MSWQLPRQAQLGGRSFDIRTDFRDILEILGYLSAPEPEFIRWQVALALFYKAPVPESLEQEAMEYLSWFIRGGEAESPPGPRLMDWQQDAAAIISDVNRVAGCEIRALKALHWWTFLSWFHAIGDGRLAELVRLRDKRRRGQKLTAQELEFCRRNKDRVELKTPLSAEEQAEQARLQKLLQS